MRGGHNPMTGILIGKQKFGHKMKMIMKTQTHIQRRLHENRRRDWSDASRSWSLLRIVSNHQRLGRKEGRILAPPPEPSERAWLCWHPDFRLLATRTVREYISFKPLQFVALCYSSLMTLKHTSWGLAFTLSVKNHWSKFSSKLLVT